MFQREDAKGNHLTRMNEYLKGLLSKGEEGLITWSVVIDAFKAAEKNGLLILDINGEGWRGAIQNLHSLHTVTTDQCDFWSMFEVNRIVRNMFNHPDAKNDPVKSMKLIRREMPYLIMRAFAFCQLEIPDLEPDLKPFARVYEKDETLETGKLDPLIRVTSSEFPEGIVLPFNSKKSVKDLKSEVERRSESSMPECQIWYKGIVLHEHPKLFEGQAKFQLENETKPLNEYLELSSSFVHVFHFRKQLEVKLNLYLTSGGDDDDHDDHRDHEYVDTTPLHEREPKRIITAQFDEDDTLVNIETHLNATLGEEKERKFFFLRDGHHAASDKAIKTLSSDESIILDVFDSEDQETIEQIMKKDVVRERYDEMELDEDGGAFSLFDM